jgi:hypothetical protein
MNSEVIDGQMRHGRTGTRLLARPLALGTHHLHVLVRTRPDPVRDWSIPLDRYLFASGLDRPSTSGGALRKDSSSSRANPGAFGRERRLRIDGPQTPPRSLLTGALEMWVSVNLCEPLSFPATGELRPHGHGKAARVSTLFRASAIRRITICTVR